MHTRHTNVTRTFARFGIKRASSRGRSHPAGKRTTTRRRAHAAMSSAFLDLFFSRPARLFLQADLAPRLLAQAARIRSARRRAQTRRGARSRTAPPARNGNCDQRLFFSAPNAKVIFQRSGVVRHTAMDRKRTRGTPLLVTCLRAFIDPAVPYL